MSWNWTNDPWNQWINQNDITVQYFMIKKIENQWETIDKIYIIWKRKISHQHNEYKSSNSKESYSLKKAKRHMTFLIIDFQWKCTQKKTHTHTHMHTNVNCQWVIENKSKVIRDCKPPIRCALDCQNQINICFQFFMLFIAIAVI